MAPSGKGTDESENRSVRKLVKRAAAYHIAPKRRNTLLCAAVRTGQGNQSWYRTLLVGLTIGIGGCGTPQSPVATATIGLDRTSAPLGAPLEVRVRFDLAPDLIPLMEDYRVLLHVLNAEEELLWTEDHDPPLPTTQWRPGQTVEYSRRIKIPMYPYVGEALIAIGLYSSNTGVRLPLAGENLGQMSYRVGSFELMPQPESSFLIYDEGWHPAEFDGDGRNDWRWTTGRAVLSFRNPMSDAFLVLEMEARPDMFETPQRLAVSIGDRILHEQVLDMGGPFHVQQEIAAEDLGSDEITRLEIRVDQTFSPASRGGAPGDTRELGLRVFYAYFEAR